MNIDDILSGMNPLSSPLCFKSVFVSVFPCTNLCVTEFFYCLFFYYDTRVLVKLGQMEAKWDTRNELVISIFILRVCHVMSGIVKQVLTLPRQLLGHLGYQKPSWQYLTRAWNWHTEKCHRLYKKIAVAKTMHNIYKHSNTP